MIQSFQTSIGPCSLSWEGSRLVGFGLLDSRTQPDSPEIPAWVSDVIGRVQAHLQGRFTDFLDLPYDFTRVSPFQESVYRAALTVKAGTTRSYGWLAEAIGQPLSASRAIGVALGQNPWPLLVPCHRFISSTGKMTGFSAKGGIETKLKLLALEGAELFAV